MTENKDKKVKDNAEQAEATDNEETPATEEYSEVEKIDPETGVKEPTDEAVEEAKEWVDEENQR